MPKTLTLLIAFSTSVLISSLVPAHGADADKYFSGKRDPFWPVGYRGNLPKPPPKKVETRRLTDEELRALALAQQERLKRHLDHKGTISKSGKRYILIGPNLVTTGDILEIEVGGEVYKLMVKALTSDNIQLEPLTE